MERSWISVCLWFGLSTTVINGVECDDEDGDEDDGGASERDDEDLDPSLVEFSPSLLASTEH